MYWTVQPGEDGKLVFIPDGYGRDPLLIDALKKPVFKRFAGGISRS
jgi:hypothetical protein